MSSDTISNRPELARSATWPATDEDKATILKQTPADNDLFKDDLEQHPENHFLSPVHNYEYYESWDSDDDDDDCADDDMEWNAGITDFALFDSDRKRAQESGEPLDAKWDNLLSSQAQALQRSIKRTRESEADMPELPGLTPDTSPSLRDNAEFEPHERVSMPVPNYLTIEVTPPQESGFEEPLIGPEDELPHSFYFARKKGLAKGSGRVKRPGLKHSRTLSGRVHVWRRPERGLFDVGEDPNAEEEAEKLGMDLLDSEGIRGRR